VNVEGFLHTRRLTRRIDGSEQQLDQVLSCGWRDNWHLSNGHEAADVMRSVSKVLHNDRLLCGLRHLGG